MLMGIINTCYAQFIKKEKALEDLTEFRELLETQSSYLQVSYFNIEYKFTQLEEDISATDSIPIYQLAYEFEKIISNIIDRHANIKIPDFEEDNIEMVNLHFPFPVASLDGKVVALSENKSIRKFEYYSDDYPFLKSINGVQISDFIELYAYKRKLSPNAARLTGSLRDLRDIGELFFKQKELDHKTVEIVLTNGIKDKTIKLPLSAERNNWSDIGSYQDQSTLMAMRTNKPFDYNKLDKWFGHSVAYLRLPMMISYKNYIDFKGYLQTTIKKYQNAKALIIDIRGNGGGTRDILNTLAQYIVQPKQSPWVANVAYVRSDQQLDEDIESMISRYLYNYHSKYLTDEDRKAIDEFYYDFNPELTFDLKKFSSPFYMVLKSNNAPIKCPVYILVNENCFSAASVFSSAFKGLPNVKIVGVNTNGSSGRSKKFYLANSNIRVKISTMLSFQRNGKTLDGNGTPPDIIIEMNKAQVFGQTDSQLEQLLELIGNH